MKEDFFECRLWTTITLKVQLPLNAKVPFYSKPITSSVGSERLRSGCNLSSDQGETVYGLAEIFFIIRWLVAWGMAGWKLEPTMIIGFRFRTGAKFVFFRETVKKLPPEYRSLLGSSSNTAMLKAENTCKKHNFYLNNFIGT